MYNGGICNIPQDQPLGFRTGDPSCIYLSHSVQIDVKQDSDPFTISSRTLSPPSINDSELLTYLSRAGSTFAVNNSLGKLRTLLRQPSAAHPRLAAQSVLQLVANTGYNLILTPSTAVPKPV